MACKVGLLLLGLAAIALAEPNDNGLADAKVDALELAGLDNKRPIFHQKNKNPDGTILGTYGYYDTYDRYHVLNYINSTFGVSIINDYLPFEPFQGLFAPPPQPTPPPEDRLPKPVFTPEDEKKLNGTGEGLDTNEHSVIRSQVLPPPSFDFFPPITFDNRQQLSSRVEDLVVGDNSLQNGTDPTGLFAATYPHIFHGLIRLDNNETAPLPPPPPPQQSSAPFTPFDFQGYQNFPYTQPNQGFPFTFLPAGEVNNGANDTSGLDSTDGEAKPSDPVELAPLKPLKPDAREAAPTTNDVAPQTPRQPQQQPGLVNSYFHQQLPYSPFETSYPQQGAFASFGAPSPYQQYPYYGYRRR